MSEELQDHQEPQAEKVETTPNVSITINDLASIHNIIEVACARAAYKPNELETVGHLYNKLSAFLSQVKEQK